MEQLISGFLNKRDDDEQGEEGGSNYDTEIDHETVLDHHEKIYKSGQVAEHSEKELGHAAAFEAFKKLSAGDLGGVDKKALVSMAMEEGMKIWQKRGSAVEDNSEYSKAQILSHATSMAMKLFNKGEGEGEGGGGGLSSLAMSYFNK